MAFTLRRKLSPRPPLNVQPVDAGRVQFSFSKLPVGTYCYRGESARIRMRKVGDDRVFIEALSEGFQGTYSVEHMSAWTDMVWIDRTVFRELQTARVNDRLPQFANRASEYTEFDPIEENEYGVAEVPYMEFRQLAISSRFRRGPRQRIYRKTGPNSAISVRIPRGAAMYHRITMSSDSMVVQLD